MTACETIASAKNVIERARFSRPGSLFRFVSGLLAILCVPPTPIAHASYESERQLGRNFALEARAQLPFITDIDVVEYVRHMGQRIIGSLEENPFEYEFAVIRDPHLNAFAVPGGYVYVHSGLLSRAATDDEVAGVLGHEVAHVHLHHLARQQEATRLMNYATLLGLMLSVIQPAVGAGAVAANAAAQLKYRREFEREADSRGVEYMKRASYDPQGMLDFFKKMSDDQRIAQASVPPYLLSHPLSDERLNNLEGVLRLHQWAGIARRPASPQLARVQVIVRARTEPINEMLAWYRRLVEERPTDAHARYLLGLAYLESGGFDPARQILEQARELGWTAADRDLGRTHLRLRQPEKARELLSRAVEAQPDDPCARAELAKTLGALGEIDEALRQYEAALALAPGFEEAHYGLGMLAGRAGREADGYFHLAEALRLRGEYDKAVRQYVNAKPLLDPGGERAELVRRRLVELDQYLGRAHPRS
jgi:predicted Zn-dependent protease